MKEVFREHYKKALCHALDYTKDYFRNYGFSLVYSVSDSLRISASITDKREEKIFVGISSNCYADIMTFLNIRLHRLHRLSKVCA